MRVTTRYEMPCAGTALKEIGLGAGEIVKWVGALPNAPVPSVPFATVPISS